MAEDICEKDNLEKLGDFLSDIKPGNSMLFYHGDADGICSATLFLGFFKGFKYSPRKGPAIGKDFVDMVLA